VSPPSINILRSFSLLILTLRRSGSSKVLISRESAFVAQRRVRSRRNALWLFEMVFGRCRAKFCPVSAVILTSCFFGGGCFKRLIYLSVLMVAEWRCPPLACHVVTTPVPTCRPKEDMQRLPRRNTYDGRSCSPLTLSTLRAVTTSTLYSPQCLRWAIGKRGNV
jgi:hypothetical protein